MSVTPFDTVAPLARLAALLADVPGIRTVYTGVPKTVAEDVAAYVTIGAQTLVDKAAGGLLQRTATYLVTLVYAVDGDAAAAELALAGAVDPFIAAVMAERSTSGSALESCTLDLTRATAAEYLAIVGQEYRRYPISVLVTQQQTIGVE